MTATIMGHLSRLPYCTTGSIADGPYDGDMIAIHAPRTPGQLWQRVGEGRASEALWTGDLIDAIGTVKRERMSKTMRTRANHPEHSWTFDLDTGPKLCTFPEPVVGGIIRAGERVK